MQQPTADELARFIADCNRRRHGRDRWQHAIRAATHRTIRRLDDETTDDTTRSRP